MNPTFLALAIVFAALSAGAIAGVRKRPDRSGKRSQSIAAGAMAAAAIAFLVAAFMSRPV